MTHRAAVVPAGYGDLDPKMWPFYNGKQSRGECCILLHALYLRFAKALFLQACSGPHRLNCVALSGSAGCLAVVGLNPNNELIKVSVKRTGTFWLAVAHAGAKSWSNL
jgi:hypothetical protein